MRKSNMKIAMVTTQYFPVISGVSYYLKQLCESLVKQKINVTVYTGGSEYLKKIETINGVVIKRFLPSMKLPRGYDYFFDMQKSITEDRPDLIHSHHYGYYPCVAGIKAAKKMNVPHVITPVFHPPKFSPVRTFLFNLYHHLSGKEALKKSDVILALSRHEIKELEKIGINGKNISVVYNPVADIFYPRKIKKSKLVMFVGPFGKTKGADIAFEIAKRVCEKVSDAHFLFVGKGALEGKFREESKIFAGRFHFASGISDNKLASCYSKSSALLSPTPYEAFGRAIAEAEACGTPVIATNVGSLPEVVENGKSGFLVKYGNWSAMETHLIDLLNDPKNVIVMGSHASKYVRKRFSEKAFVNKHVEIYTKLLQ